MRVAIGDAETVNTVFFLDQCLPKLYSVYIELGGERLSGRNRSLADMIQQIHFRELKIFHLPEKYKRAPDQDVVVYFMELIENLRSQGELPHGCKFYLATHDKQFYSDAAKNLKDKRYRGLNIHCRDRSQSFQRADITIHIYTIRAKRNDYDEIPLQDVCRRLKRFAGAAA